MTTIILKVLLIMGVLFAFALPGFILKKTGLVKTDSLASVSNVLLCAAQPMLVIKAFAVDPLPPTPSVLMNFLWVFLLSVAAVMLAWALSRLVFSFMRRPEQRRERDVLVFIGTFSNCSFIGIPFIDMFTGGNAEAMMYMIVFSVAFNFILWTLGAYLMTQDKKNISLKKALLNPGTVGAVAGLLLFLFPQINVFDMDGVAELQQIVVYMGNMTAPLSMMIVGVRLADLPVKKLFCNPKIYLAAAIRLLLTPAATFLLILPFKLAGVFADTPYVLLAPVIAMAMPPAASVVAFAEKMDGERELSAAAFSTGTILSILTLPVVLSLIVL